MSDQKDPAVQAGWAYEGLHVDALFRQWVAPMLDAAGVTTGSRVLDVACGTGVLARGAWERVGPSGAVTGLDIGAGMLAVAEQLEPGVRWMEGDAGALPFDDDEFDAVVSQFGLMFFGDRVRAVGEMLRCATPGAPVTVAVWDALESTEVYPALVDLFGRRAGDEAAEALSAPFAMGDADELRALFEEAGAATVAIDTRRGTARFPSVRTMVEAELRGWLPVMGVTLDETLIHTILAEAEDAMGSYVADAGKMVFDVSAHLVTARG